MIQGSPEWFAARVGKATASRIGDILAGGKGLTRQSYMDQLVAERITGLPCGDSFESDAMTWGKDTEPLARSSYEAEKGVLVDEVGLIDHPVIAFAAASPDGLVNDDGILEIKCPKSRTHTAYLRDREVPAKYLPQIMFQLACTGRKWADFVSFDPRFQDPKLRMMVVRVERDDKLIAKIESEVAKFLSEVERAVSSLAAAEKTHADAQNPFAR